jgi:catechol 2,3-dioxygenase-like lactoylglutathione lyase family enzyme
MQVGGIPETALYVSDIKRSGEFYRRLFGFPTLLESERLLGLDPPAAAL